MRSQGLTWRLLNVLLAVLLACGCSPAMAFAAEASSSSSATDAKAAETADKTDKPVEPDAPEKPEKPETPAAPDEPEKPADPADPEKPADPADPAEPERYYVDTLLLQWDKPDDYDVKHFVGDSPIVEPAYRAVSITEFGEKVQLNGWYLSTDGLGTAYQTADSSTAIGAFDLTWKSSDETIATVDPTGLVTPKGKNGTVTITATVADANVYEGTAPAATVTIAFDGQEGKYVEKVEILDDAGNAIGEAWGGTTVYADENAFHQLQARVTWRNVATGATEVQVTGSGDEYRAANVDTTITWGVSASNTFSINEDTGRLRTGAYAGNAYVTCTVVGGLGGKAVTDTANVQLDTGKYEYDPAESLTLKVVWEERPDEVVKEATFTYEELLARLSSTHVNATIGNGSRYGVISADGWLFKDVVGLVSVADADVLQYRFATRDGYDNPVSYRYLFESGNRYYFPNYDIGSRAEGQIVPPVLAYRSSLEWNRSEANPAATLDDGNRFRLVFGCLAEGDANTSFQIYYITGITVVLAGAPSAGTDGPGAGDDPDPSPGDNPDPGAGGDSEPEDNPGSPDPGQGGSDDEGNGSGARAGRADSHAASPNEGASSGAGDAAADEPDAIGDSKRWRVYQMMNKTNSDVPDWDDENPLSPFAVPLALGTLATGAGATTFGFRRRLR